MTAVNAAEDNTVSQFVASAFSNLRSNSFSTSMDAEFLRNEFKLMVLGKPTKSGKFQRLGDIKPGTKMVVNNSHTRTLASVSWKEDDRVYAASFLIEDETPTPRSIIDLSNSLR